MTVVNWICGGIGLVMVIVFLGKYAVSVHSLPLWIIIVGVLVLPVADVVLSIRRGNDNQGGNRNVTGD